MKCLGQMDYDEPGFFLDVLDEKFSEFDEKHGMVDPVKLQRSWDNIHVTFSDHTGGLLPGIYIINDLFNNNLGKLPGIKITHNSGFLDNIFICSVLCVIFCFPHKIYSS